MSANLNSVGIDQFDLVVSKLSQVKQTAKGVRAQCPAHDDSDPSLDVDLGDDGRVLLNCRSARCSTESIVAAIGLTVRDLFPPKPEGAKPRESAARTPKRHATLEAACRAATWSATDAGRKPGKLKCTRHDYTDVDGNVLGGVFRFDFDDGRPKELRRYRRDGDCWVLKDIEAPRPLFRLDALHKAPSEAPVLFCSGRSESDPPAALKLTHPTARFHTGSATVAEPLEVDFLSAAALRRWR